MGRGSLFELKVGEVIEPVDVGIVFVSLEFDAVRFLGLVNYPVLTQKWKIDSLPAQDSKASPADSPDPQLGLSSDP